MISRDLQAYARDALAVIARFQGLAVGEREGKAALVQRLVTHLTRRETVAASLTTLLPHHRVALERVQLAGGSRSVGALERELRRAGFVAAEPSGGRPESVSPDRAESTRIGDVIAHLTARGLLLTTDFSDYRVGEAGLATPGRTAFIPTEVLHLLPPARPLGPPAELSRVADAGLDIARRDVLLYWSYADRNDVQVIARGTVAKRHLVRIAQSLLVPEEAEAVQVEEALDRTYFLRILLIEARLLDVTGGRLRARPEARAFFERPDAEQSRILYRTWLEGQRWNEINRILVPTDTYVVDSARPEMKASRTAIAQLVGETTPGEWVGLEEFLARVRRDHYEFLIPRKTHRGNRVNPYATHSGNPFAIAIQESLAADESVGWEIVEAEVIRQFLLVLNWLGLIALGYDGDRLVGFRQSTEGRAIIRGEPIAGEPSDGNGAATGMASEAASEKSLVVQASFQIFAYQHTPTSVLAALEFCGERLQAGPVFEYRLTRESVYRGRRNGFGAERVLGLLQSHSSTPVPQNIRQSLLDWEREHERVILRPGVSIIHALDAARLDALAADPSLAPLLVSRLAPDVLALGRGDSATTLVGELVGRGEFVAIGRDDEPPRPMVDVEPDGRIGFGGELPSIYHWRKLAAFCEPRDGELRVTTASLRRAAEAGLKPEEVLATLQAFSRTPIPPAVKQAISAGVRRWGEIGVSPAVLVQVESREILDQLLAEPGLAGLLRRLKEQETIAVARLEDVERLSEALAALGINPSRVVR